MTSATIDKSGQGGQDRAPGGARGFTLIELAITIFIVGLLVGSILVPLATQVEQRQIRDTQKTLEEIKDALVGFALANGYLPCPDIGINGSENVAGTGRCAAISADNIASGRLPHVNLGLASSDPWGNRFSYFVNERYARRSPDTPMSLSPAGTDIRVCATSACVPTATLSTTAVFAVVSHGKNGFGATNLASGMPNPASGSADEQENYSADRDLVSRPQFTGGPVASEFDDIVVWLSRYTLFNRMVSAGRLP